MRRVLIGVVGYYPFIRGYPLGPDFMQRLQALPWPEASAIEIQEMNWGPIAIVQDLQARAIAYDRAVLVGAVARGRRAGSVGCLRWRGGELDPLAVQQRVYEGVTGVVSLDNLLVIGDYFEVWPDSVITVEAELPQSRVGDLVLAERMAERPGIVGDRPLSAEAEKIVQGLLELTWGAAVDGFDGLPGISILTANDLNPVGDWCQNRFIEDAELAGYLP